VRTTVNSNTKEPTLDELIKARHDIAIIVRRFGERFMPTFERLDAEVTAREVRDAALERAILAGR